MFRTIRIVPLIILLFAVATWPQKPSAPQTQLVGLWRLVSIETVRLNGTVVTDWMGRNPTGSLVYDRTGHVFVQIMHGPRVTWKTTELHSAGPPFESIEAASIAEKSAAFDGYYAYYGSYELNEKDFIVRHHIESSLWPPEVGTIAERHFQLFGDRLTLSTGTFTFKGEQSFNRLVWERVK